MDRTRFPESFPRAVAAVDQVLAEYEDNKRGVWRERSALDHLSHAQAHLDALNELLSDREHLTHAVTRALMALELYEEKR